MIMKVCDGCQNQLPVEYINIHNKKCQMYQPLNCAIIENLLFKCEYCQLDFPNELKQEHLSLCNTKTELEAIIQEQQNYPEFVYQLQNIRHHQSLVKKAEYVAQDSTLFIENQKQEQQNIAVQKPQFCKVPQKQQFSLLELENQFEQKQQKQQQNNIIGNVSQPMFQQSQQLKQVQFRQRLDQIEFDEQDELPISRSRKLQFAAVQTTKENMLKINVIKNQMKIDIESLNSIKYVPSSNLSDEHKKCSICITDYEEGEVLILLPCTHRYHSECIGNWLKTSWFCPICKNDIRN